MELPENEKKLTSEVAELKQQVESLTQSCERMMGMMSNRLFFVPQDIPFGDHMKVGGDLDGVQQPFCGAIVLLETIAEFGCLSFYADGHPTENRQLCLRIAKELRESQENEPIVTADTYGSIASWEVAGKDGRSVGSTNLKSVADSYKKKGFNVKPIFG